MLPETEQGAASSGLGQGESGVAAIQRRRASDAEIAPIHASGRFGKSLLFRVVSMGLM
jgi:hypothetical protein